MKHHLVVCFDADDTLWINEPNFRKGEDAFCTAVKEYADYERAHKVLYKHIIGRLPLYGYGVKSFVLSMIEAAAELTTDVPASLINTLIAIGENMLQVHLELLPDVESVLQELQKEFRLIVATKGELLDQERKLQRSGLLDYFHHIEVMSEKDEQSYLKMLRHLDIDPAHFVMIGNSLKSDILPVLAIGGNAIHIPFEITWVLEEVKKEAVPEGVITVQKHSEIPAVIRSLAGRIPPPVIAAEND